MRGDLSLGGFRVRGMVNHEIDQDGANLRTPQDSEMCVLEQVTDAVNTTVSDSFHNNSIAV